LTDDELKAFAKKYPWIASQIAKQYTTRVRETEREKKERLKDVYALRANNIRRGLAKRRRDKRDRESAAVHRPTNAQRISKLMPKRRVYVAIIEGKPAAFTGKYFLPFDQMHRIEGLYIKARDSLSDIRKDIAAHERHAKKKGWPLNTVDYQYLYVEPYPILSAPQKKAWITKMLAAAKEMTPGEILSVPQFVADLVALRNKMGTFGNIHLRTKPVRVNKKRKPKNDRAE
jgi:hypothetical protein